MYITFLYCKIIVYNFVKENNRRQYVYIFESNNGMKSNGELFNAQYSTAATSCAMKTNQDLTLQVPHLEKTHFYT